MIVNLKYFRTKTQPLLRFSSQVQAHWIVHSYEKIRIFALSSSKDFFLQKRPNLISKTVHSITSGVLYSLILTLLRLQIYNTLNRTLYHHTNVFGAPVQH